MPQQAGMSHEEWLAWEKGKVQRADALEHAAQAAMEAHRTTGRHGAGAAADWSRTAPATREQWRAIARAAIDAHHARGGTTEETA